MKKCDILPKEAYEKMKEQFHWNMFWFDDAWMFGNKYYTNYRKENGYYIIRKIKDYNNIIKVDCDKDKLNLFLKALNAEV